MSKDFPADAFADLFGMKPQENHSGLVIVIAPVAEDKPGHPSLCLLAINKIKSYSQGAKEKFITLLPVYHAGSAKSVEPR